MLNIKPVAVPIEKTNGNEWRVKGTRIPIDTVIFAFNRGDSPQAIVEQYPVLTLADVYGVIAYYLQSRVEVDEYLEKRRRRAERIEEALEAVGGDLRKLPPDFFESE
jgi:uncharacterized protein (DUF433 family)